MQDLTNWTSREISTKIFLIILLFHLLHLLDFLLSIWIPPWKICVIVGVCAMSLLSLCKVPLRHIYRPGQLSLSWQDRVLYRNRTNGLCLGPTGTGEGMGEKREKFERIQEDLGETNRIRKRERKRFIVRNWHVWLWIWQVPRPSGWVSKWDTQKEPMFQFRS